MLDVALETMQTTGCSMAPVVEPERTVGLLTLENIIEYISFRKAPAGAAANEVHAGSLQPNRMEEESRWDLEGRCRLLQCRRPC
jgi:CBS domain containing-hemolysin-like protein